MYVYISVFMYMSVRCVYKCVHVCETGWKPLFAGHRMHEPRTRPDLRPTAAPTQPCQTRCAEVTWKRCLCNCGARTIWTFWRTNLGTDPPPSPRCSGIPLGAPDPKTLLPLSLIARAATFDYHGLEVINSWRSHVGLCRGYSACSPS